MIINSLFLFLFIVLAIISFYRIHIGISLIFLFRLLIPIDIARIHIGPLDLRLTTVYTIIMLSAYIYNYHIKKNIPPLYKSHEISKPFLFLLGGLVFVSLFSSDFTLDFRLLSIFRLINAEILPAIFAWLVFRKKEEINTFNKVLIIGVFIISLYGLFCYITKSNPYISVLSLVYRPDYTFLDSALNKERLIGGLVQSTFQHSLTFSGICILLFFYSFNLNIKNKLKVVTLALIVFCIFIAGSRSGIIALMLGILYLVYKSNWHIKLRFLRYSLFFCIIGIIIINLSPMLEQYKSLIQASLFFLEKNDLGGSSINMRSIQFDETLRMIRDNPLFGLGSGFINEYLTINGPHPVLFGFESVIFYYLIETGFIGLILWLIFYFKLYKIISNIKLKKRDSFQKNSLLSMFIAYMFFIIFTAPISTLYCFFFLYVLGLKSLKMEVDNKNLILKSN